jgi:hypothetical protein
MQGDTMTREQLRSAVLCLTTEQARQTWTREQEFKCARGMEHFERLIDVQTGRVVAQVAK